jgi:subtilisin family serine protease
MSCLKIIRNVNCRGHIIRTVSGIAMLLILLAGGAGALYNDGGALTDHQVLVNLTDGVTASIDLPLPVRNVDTGEDFSSIHEAISENKIIIQFYDEPVLNYAVGLKAEFVRGQDDVKKMEANAKIKAYKDKLSNIHSNVKKEIEKNNITIKIIRDYYEVFNGFAAEVSKKEDVIKLKNISNIKAVYPDQKVYALLTDSVPLINATKVWQIQDSNGTNVTGKNVKVAVIDTGIDYMHPDLGGGFGPAYKVIAGWDIYNNDSDPMDDYGHGTHVAGIAAANGTLRGVAPDAKLMAYKVLSSEGWGLWSDVIAGVDKAVDPDGNPLTNDGADIISMSLGGWGDPDDPVSQSVDNANDAGVLVVVAAGNSGPYKNTIGSPGTARKALTVGATDKSDVIASFSSRGPVTWTNGSIIKPEVVAPGVNIYSTVPSGTCALCSPSKYNILSGTSMATPHVSGAAALLLQLHPEWTPEQLKSALITTAVDLNYDVYTQGAGRIDVFKGATVEALVTPSVLSLGVMNTSKEIWEVYRDIELKNIASTAKNFNITVQMPYSPGVTTGLSVTNVSLNPGSCIVFNFRLSVNNSVVLDGDYEGDIIVQYESMIMRIPFGFVKLPAELNDVYGDYGIDNDNNGLYDYLAIDVGVNVSKAGYYTVEVDLHSIDGYQITQNSTYGYLPAGSQNATVLLDGIDIRRNKINGTYVLDAWLMDGNWSLVDYRNDPYITHYYNYTDFQRPPAEFMPGISDYGSDTDSNGLYDYLAVEKQVNVTTAGTYELDGYLYNSSGYYIGSAYNYTYLNAGVQNITLQFSGVSIYRSNSTGNFTVYTYLYGYSSSGLSSPLERTEKIEKLPAESELPENKDVNASILEPLAVSQQQVIGVWWQWFDSAIDITSSYNYTQFERPPARFSDAYSDYGLDTDSNGFYDYLVIDVGVNVSRAGYYQISGYLYNSSGWYFGWADNYTILNAGNQTVQLRFDGAEIWQSRTNGTFDLRDLYLYNANDWNEFDYRYYACTTKYYNYTEFLRPLDTIGVYRSGVFYLRNSNDQGFADLTFGYGISGDTPAVGDWDGDGTDTVGVYRSGVFYLRNSNDAGIADHAFGYGISGDTPVVGDWDGDGTDTVGVYRDGVFYLRNSNDAGIADLAFGYGISGDMPVVGDWNDDGTATIGVYRGDFYLRNSNDAGVADLAFGYGAASDTPVIGNWDGQ